MLGNNTLVKRLAKHLKKRESQCELLIIRIFSLSTVTLNKEDKNIKVYRT